MTRATRRPRPVSRSQPGSAGVSDAPLGHGVERDRGGDAGVERLDRSAIGIETSWSQVSATSRRQTVALGADHDDQRAVGEVEVAAGDVAVGGEADRPCSRPPGSSSAGGPG